MKENITLGITSNRLSCEKEKILSLWEERCLQEVTSARTASNLALRNSLPMYLDHLGEALAANRKMDVKSVLVHDTESVRIGRLHGADRAGTASYVLTEVILEYSILRCVIFERLETDGQLSAIQRDIIFDSIEQAVNDAAVKFSEVHADIQQKFVTTLTHDLRTPITSAKMAAQLILKRSDRPDDCVRSAARIVGSLSRVSSMINDLLDVSRLRAGEELSLAFSHCDLAFIVRDVVDEMSDVLENQIKFICTETLEGYWGSDGLRRVTENLVGNAAKYGESGKPITVSLSGSESMVKLVVHNEGLPIPEHEIPLLFQQYRRTKTARESSKTGWGLGLTLVKGVVDAHKGEASVTSSIDRGTSFILKLPYLEAPATTDQMLDH